MNTNDATGAAGILATQLATLGSAPFLQTLLPRVLAGLAIYLALLVLLRLGRRSPLVTRFSAALHWLGLACILKLFLGSCLGTVFPIVPRLLAAAVVFFLVVLLLKWAEVLLFEYVFIRQGRKPVPVVLRDIGRAFLTVVFLVVIVKGFFPQLNFNVVAVSSLVVGFVLANATQDTLGSLVSGLALNAENSFSIGDWIAVGDRIGKVTDITWRSTRLQTEDSEDIIVPNATLNEEILINYSRPTPELRVHLRIGLDYEAPPNTVRGTILEAVREIPDIATTPEPQVLLAEFADSAIIYDIVFFIHEYPNKDEITSDLMSLLWYRLQRAGISIPYPVRDVRLRPADPVAGQAAVREQAEAVASLFKGSDLFAPLSEEERRELAAGCRVQTYARGEDIVRQNEAGHSLFVVQSGRTGVHVDQPERKRVKVCDLGPGAFFGERSLLTGEPRSATVTALEDTVLVELDKAAFGEVLKAKPEMAEYLGRVLAQRDQSREALAAGAGAARADEKEAQKSRHFMSRILTFFGMS